MIRTTGQLPKYEKAEDPRTHTTEAGEAEMHSGGAAANSAPDSGADAGNGNNQTTGGFNDAF